MFAKLTLGIVLLSILTNASAQDPNKVLRISQCNQYLEEGKPEMIAYVKQQILNKKCLFYDDYSEDYLLGQIYEQEDSFELAGSYYATAFKLSKDCEHPNIAERYIRTLTRLSKFDLAYKEGLAICKEFPDNKRLWLEFKDACMWAFFIKHMNLNETYLSDFYPRETYITATNIEQVLIVRNLTTNKKNYVIDVDRSQKGYAQKWVCHYSDQERKTILFLLTEKNFDKMIAQLSEKAENVLLQSSDSEVVRMGALFALLPLDEKTFKETMKKLEAESNFTFCLCKEIRPFYAPKIQDLCGAAAHLD